jgi:hypothetical protein
MTKLSVLLLLLCSLGCEKDQKAHIEVPKPVKAPASMTQNEFDLQLTTAGSQATIRIYQCITEMYSLAYTPTSSGPVCRDACELYKHLNEFEEAHPALNANVGDGTLTGVPHFCGHKKSKRVTRVKP